MSADVVPMNAVAEWRPRLPEGWIVRGFQISRSMDWQPDVAMIELEHYAGWAVALEYIWPVAPEDAEGLFEFLTMLAGPHNTRAVYIDARWAGRR